MILQNNLLRVWKFKPTGEG